MPTKPHTTTAQQLNAAQLAITNSLADPDIKAAVAQYGYTTTKLNAEEKKIGVTSRRTSEGRGDEGGTQRSAKKLPKFCPLRFASGCFAKTSEV